jgi:hypothetical protein
MQDPDVPSSSADGDGWEGGGGIATAQAEAVHLEGARHVAHPAAGLSSRTGDCYHDRRRAPCRFIRITTGDVPLPLLRAPKLAIGGILGVQLASTGASEPLMVAFTVQPFRRTKHH